MTPVEAGRRAYPGTAIPSHRFGDMVHDVDVDVDVVGGGPLTYASPNAEWDGGMVRTAGIRQDNRENFLEYK